MKHVLYIEDSETLRGLFKAWFAEVDCVVDLAESGEIALHKLSDTGYEVDVVVVDFEMDGINGLEFGQLIRHMDHHRSTPIVMLTSHCNDHLRDDCQEIGYVDCFEKGNADRACLIECVRHLLFTEDAQPEYGPVVGESDVDEVSALKYVMYVDDSVSLRRLFSSFMEEERCKVELVENGEKAVELLGDSEQLYALIVMDYRMVDLDGIEATRLIRGMIQYEKTPVVLYTSDAIGEIKEEFLAAGGNACFRKGCQDWGLFSEFVKQCLEGDVDALAA